MLPSVFVPAVVDALIPKEVASSARLTTVESVAGCLLFHKLPTDCPDTWRLLESSSLSIKFFVLAGFGATGWVRKRERLGC